MNICEILQIDINKHFTVDKSNVTRNNGYKIIGKRFHTHEAKHFFFNRVVNVWNSLPRNITECVTVATFKNRLDKYLASNPRLDMFTTE